MHLLQKLEQRQTWSPMMLATFGAPIGSASDLKSAIDWARLSARSEYAINYLPI
jgi:hypothetical protein